METERPLTNIREKVRKKKDWDEKIRIKDKDRGII